MDIARKIVKVRIKWSRRIGIIVLCLLLVGYTHAQKTKQLRGNQSTTALLEQAKAAQIKNPQYAIQLVEQAIRMIDEKKTSRLKRTAKEQLNLNEEAEAYVLLGEIYEAIKQEELALQRYEQAMKVWAGSEKGKYDLHYQMGTLFLKLGNDQSAEQNFRICEQATAYSDLRVRCAEGLADVQFLRGNVTQCISQLEDVKAEFTLDSLSIARIDAKTSRGYYQIGDYYNANKYLDRSLNTLPNNNLQKEDIKIITDAKQEYYNSAAFSLEEKAEKATSNNARTDISLPSEIKVQENLQVANLYEAEDNLPKAEEFIATSKELIDENTAVAVVAEVYKKSAEINRKVGAFDAALLDIERYSRAKEQAIRDLETELAQQIEIVKEQQKIDLNRKDFDIESKEKELLGVQLQKQKIISGFLGLLLLAALVSFYFISKSVRAKRRANQMLLLKSLRTQMNPHFIFNALNSVNNFIANSNEKAANKFLAEFSRLMRKVLDYSQRDFISFEEEIELNKLYLKLEHFRFRDKFDYEFQDHTTANTYELAVPPMLIQPFIENAVWHGLRYKESKGNLQVSINEVDGGLLVTIKDDGIGRKKSQALKTKNQRKYKSMGLENVSKRIALINELYQKNYAIEVQDVDEEAEDTGTLVSIKIPS